MVHEGAPPPCATALVNGAAGVITMDGGPLFAVYGFTVAGGKIEIDIVSDAERLRLLRLS